MSKRCFRTSTTGCQAQAARSEITRESNITVPQSAGADVGNHAARLFFFPSERVEAGGVTESASADGIDLGSRNSRQEQLAAIMAGKIDSSRPIEPKLPRNLGAHLVAATPIPGPIAAYTSSGKVPNSSRIFLKASTTI